MTGTPPLSIGPQMDVGLFGEPFATAVGAATVDHDDFILSPSYEFTHFFNKESSEKICVK
jgi:hypothetical protein